MFGCCECAGLKIRDASGVVDDAHREAVRASLKLAERVPKGEIEAAVLRLESCDCPCHVDGEVCFC